MVRGAVILFVFVYIIRMPEFNITTTVEAKVFKRAEPIWERIPERERGDKPKMLQYFRGNTPRRIFGDYQLPDHQDPILSQAQDVDMNTETGNSQNNQNIIVGGDVSGESEQKSEFEEPATLLTILPLPGAEKDSGTCNWHGKQPKYQRRMDQKGPYVQRQNAPDVNRPGQMGPGQMGPGQMGPGQMGPGQMGPGQMGPGQMGPGQMGPGQNRPGQKGPGKDRDSVDNVGLYIRNTLECMQKKFLISTEKIKNRVCGMFELFFPTTSELKPAQSKQPIKATSKATIQTTTTKSKTTTTKGKTIAVKDADIPKTEGQTTTIRDADVPKTERQKTTIEADMLTTESQTTTIEDDDTPTTEGQTTTIVDANILATEGHTTTIKDDDTPPAEGATASNEDDDTPTPPAEGVPASNEHDDSD